MQWENSRKFKESLQFTQHLDDFTFKNDTTDRILKQAENSFEQKDKFFPMQENKSTAH